MNKIQDTLKQREIIEKAMDKAIQMQEKITEPFFTSQYPFLEDDFIDSLNKLINDYTDHENIITTLSSDNLILTDGNTVKVDSDGFPYVISTVEIKELNLKYDIIIYHHSEWDFYFNN